MAVPNEAGVRPYLTAWVVAVTAALVIDAVLQLAMDAVRVSASGRAPWWITTNLVERGRWVVFAMCLWYVGPRLVDSLGGALRAAPADAWRQVAAGVVALPLLWIVATWAVSAVRFTLLGTWTSDGRVFLSGDYYSALVLSLAPWLLAGAVVSAIARHMD